MESREVQTPVDRGVIDALAVGDIIEITGTILTGRDAVLPRLVKDLEQGKWNGPSMCGAVIFHTGVSAAGVGPTSSNKKAIEGCIPPLSEYGVRIHLGKGSLSAATVEALRVHRAVFAITTPTSALFRSRVEKQEVVSYREEGMEAMHALTVERFPAVVAIAHGRTIWER